MEQADRSVCSRKPSILIVDDEPFNLDLLQSILGDRCAVRTALGGEAALLLAAGDDPPDLILLDVMMPGMTGYEVCRRLKSNPETARIPVIFVSGMHEIEDEIKGFELGCADYIIKPVSAAVVVARVNTHLKLYQQERHLLALVQELSTGSDDVYSALMRRLGGSQSGDA